MLYSLFLVKWLMFAFFFNHVFDCMFIFQGSAWYIDKRKIYGLMIFIINGQVLEGITLPDEFNNFIIFSL